MARYRELAPLASGLLMMQRAKDAGDQAAFNQALKVYETEMAGMKDIMTSQEASQRMDIAGAKETQRRRLEDIEYQQAEADVGLTGAQQAGVEAGTELTGVQAFKGKQDVLMTAKQWETRKEDESIAEEKLKAQGILEADETIGSLGFSSQAIELIAKSENLAAEIAENLGERRAVVARKELEKREEVIAPETKAEVSEAELRVAEAIEKQKVIKLRQDYNILDEVAQTEVKEIRLKRAKLLGAEVEEQAKQLIDYYGRMPDIVLRTMESQIARNLASALSGEDPAYQAQALEIAATMKGVDVPTLVAQDWLIEHGFDMTLKDYQSQLRILSTAAGSLTAAATTKEVYDEISAVADLGEDKEGMGMLAMLMGASNRTLSDAEKQTAIRRLDNHIKSLVGNAKNIHSSFDWDAFLTNLSGKAILPPDKEAAAARALVGDTVGK